MERVDCIVVGAGVIGLAVARRLAMAGVETLLLEREATPGVHASSRNSEVIHAGIYYPPGSHKARLCVRGRRQLYRYCEEHGIAHRRCGKLLVASSSVERNTLQHYADTAQRNGVTDLAWLTPAEVSAIEPDVRCAAALWSPSTGILSSHEFMQALLGDLEGHGGTLACRAEVVGGRLSRGSHRVAVQQDAACSEFEARLVVNAAGLWAQSLAWHLTGLDASSVPRQHFAKGHYFTLQGRAPFSHLIYPVANDAGLGIHVTLDLAGQVRFGPDVEWLPTIDYSFDESRTGSVCSGHPALLSGARRAATAVGLHGHSLEARGPGGTAGRLPSPGPGRARLGGVGESLWHRVARTHGVARDCGRGRCDARGG